MSALGLISKEFVQAKKVTAANQGLIQSLLIGNSWMLNFILVRISIAEIYRAYAIKKLKLFYIQGVPVIILLVLNSLN